VGGGLLIIVKPNRASAAICTSESEKASASKGTTVPAMSRPVATSGRGYVRINPRLLPVRAGTGQSAIRLLLEFGGVSVAHDRHL